MADMTSMNVSLPNTLRVYVQHRVETGGFGNVSEYIRDLIRRDREARVQDALTAAIREGLESGTPIPVDDQYFERKKAELLERHSRAKSA